MRTKNNDQKKIKRRKRHQLRKFILALDYIVECIGCILILFIFLIGDQYLLQHVFLTVAIFIYGVPIPIAYLLNETRVRDVIVNKGWIEGFKAIFYSSKRIKQKKRKKVLGWLHQEEGQSILMKKKIVLSSCRKFKFEEEVKPPDDWKETSSAQLPKGEVNIMINEMYNIENENTLLTESEGNTDADISSSTQRPPATTQTKPLDEVALRKKIHANRNNQSKESGALQTSNGFHSTKKGNNENSKRKNSHLFVDASLIEATFSEESETVVSILKDDTFKVFARNHILNHILNDLNKGKSDSDYHKYFEHI